MKPYTKYIFVWIRFIVILSSLVLAIDLESPSPHRLKILLAFFMLLFASIHGKEYKKIRSSKFYPLFFILDVILLFLIESQSKFLLNYYMHFNYFILLLSAGIQLPRVKGTLINCITFLLSMVKFHALLQIHFSPANLSLTIFSFFTALLAIIIINYAKYEVEERKKTNLLYDELRNYSVKLKELTIVEERNRIAMEIHDAVGHRMTGLIMELEMSKRLLFKDPKKVEELLQHAVNTAREGLIDVRSAVDTLKEDLLPLYSSPNSFEALIHNFQLQTGLKIELSINPPKIQLPRTIAEALYRIIQEALTNTAKHSEATLVSIRIEAYTRNLLLEIMDNGTASGTFHEGNGLLGMRKRLNDLEGKIYFHTASGFHILAEIPLSTLLVDSPKRGEYYVKN